MSQLLNISPKSDDAPGRGRILNSWKEIANYLGRGVRTVQRWELELQLPVRRPRGKSRSAVLALANELDEWLQKTAAYRTAGLDTLHTVPSPAGLRVLVVEDNPNDLRECIALLSRIGAKEIDVASTIRAALLRLGDIESGKLPDPDLIILDLAFAVESGFEVLRYRKAHDKLKSVPVIVWTALGGSERDLCEFLGAKRVVPKWLGPRELEAALRNSEAQAA